ncbi:MAG TPA: hypothetical protein IGS37_00670 [Synechococcales cyanobacterium M55_K2018_004]|nr:hypothetical protein [Synechococcales cyanobacterium M55_K2018_004]
MDVLHSELPVLLPVGSPVNLVDALPDCHGWGRSPKFRNFHLTTASSPTTIGMVAGAPSKIAPSLVMPAEVQEGYLCLQERSHF